MYIVYVKKLVMRQWKTCKNMYRVGLKGATTPMALPTKNVQSIIRCLHPKIKSLFHSTQDNGLRIEVGHQVHWSCQLKMSWNVRHPHSRRQLP